MADNVPITAGAGTSIAADDISSVFYQRVKLSLGADGVAVDAVAGAGAVSTGVQRMTLASDDPAVVAIGAVGVLPATLGAKVAAGSVSVVGPSDAPLSASTPGGLQAIHATQIVRPANTTQYTIGDLVAGNGVNFFTIPNAVRASGEAIRVERVRLRKSSPVLTAASFRVHLLRSAPTVNVSDNGIFNTSGVLALSTIEHAVGFFDIIMDRAAVIGARGNGIPDVGTSATLSPVSGTSLFAVVEALAGYTPTSAETFDLILEGQWA